MWPERVFPELHTDRLILREHRLADQQAVYAIFADEQVTRFYNVPTFTHPDEALPFLQRRIDRFLAKKGIRWAITLKGDDRLIGSCGINAWSRLSLIGEIGYELARPYWNQGIMTEALHAVITYGFDRMRLIRLDAWIVPDNAASGRVLHKVGFHSQGLQPRKGYWNGRHHDLELYTIDLHTYRLRPETRRER